MNEFDVHHALTHDREKRRVLARFTIDRGPKFVGKRIAVRIPTTDMDIAVMVRDAILDFCLAIGLRVNRRPQRRKQRQPEEGKAS